MPAECHRSSDCSIFLVTSTCRTLWSFILIMCLQIITRSHLVQPFPSLVHHSILCQYIQNCWPFVTLPGLENSLFSSGSHAFSSSSPISACPSASTPSLWLNSCIWFPLPTSLLSWPSDGSDWYPSIWTTCQVISGQKAVTWATALWNSWDLSMCCSWEGYGAVEVTITPPCCSCQTNSQGYSCIDKNLLCSQYLDISPPFSHCGPHLCLPPSLRCTIRCSGSVCASLQNQLLCARSA